MKRGIAFGSGFLAVALWLLPCLGGQESKDAIVSGERIGQVRLGMDGDELEKLLGKPALDESSTGGRAVETWIAKSSDGRTEQTEVAIRRSKDEHHQQVAQAAITSPFFRTRGGNSTNSDLDAIWREFPNLRYCAGDIGGHGSDLELYDDVASGIAFLIERTRPAAKGEPWGKCRAVIVHPGGQEVIQRVVGAPLDQASGG